MKKMTRCTPTKRPHSLSPVGRTKSSPTKPEGRSKSLSTTVMRKRGPLDIDGGLGTDSLLDSTYIQNQEEEKDPIIMPQRIVTKMSRMLAIKKREFLNMRKTLMSLQNTVLENYASMKELESRVNPGRAEEQGTDLRVVSLRDWPAHDLMLLVRDDIEVIRNLEINSYLGSHVLQQLSTRLSPLPEEIKIVFGELFARRLDLLDMLRYKHRLDRSTYCTNLDWKTKNAAFDSETERLQKMMTETTENVKTQVHTCFQLAKIPWMDRNAILKKLDRAQKENIVLQNKLEEIAKSNKNSAKNVSPPTSPGSQVTAKHTQMEGNQSNSLAEELAKERAACETLKEVVASAETMLRVARARIATLERQIKEMRTELDGARKKQKDIEQLYRTRETSYDARSKKLLEISKTGEMAIDTLSRQRDALELRVKELREQAAQAEQAAKAREAIQQARIDAFQAKVQEQEKNKLGANARVTELQAKVKELESLVQALREHSAALEEMDNKRCLEYLPMKEKEPTERETDLWKELQVARTMLSRAEEQLRQSRIDKDNFLNSLARIAQQGEGQGEGSQNVQAMELLEKEQQIDKLKRSVEEHEENIKSMEESMTQYENQLAGLRLEVRRLRNYDCFAKEVKYEDLETELLDLNMQIATLNRERSVLVSATAARALMLERYERATALFANMIRVRKELRALFDGRSTPPMIDDICKSEVTRSISSVCVNAADTWTALRAERVRVMRLEAALLTQRLQLERQGQVRTLLEQRRATCERIVAETTQNFKLESGRWRDGGCMASSAARPTFSYP